MSATAIVGANWGDEGKGKMTDVLARDADWVVRYQGGNNAGHTIVNERGAFALHLLPSGVFYPHVANVLGPGVAVNISALMQELENLQAHGVPDPKLWVSDRAQVVLPMHIRFDQLEEERLGTRQFGSTRSGIAPFYADKALKIGLRVADLFEKERMRDAVERSLDLKNVLMVHGYGEALFDGDAVVETLHAAATAVEPYVADTTTLLQQAIRRGERVVLEGQLGALRDPDHGIHPFTTSSSTLAGFASVGAGIPPTAITRIIAVTKAYSSCVGAGPFVTELAESEAVFLRERGGFAGEYGATTGRPRRVGWFDAPATRYGAALQGATEVALTNLDVLGAWEEIPMCVAYRIGRDIIHDFPTSSALEQAEPVLETMPGWNTDLAGITAYQALPQNAQRYVERLEELIKVPIRFVSIGPRRDQIVAKP